MRLVMQGTDANKGVSEANGGSAARDYPEMAARKVMLATIGALASAYDTAEETCDRLVERGEAAREEWEHRSQEMREENRATRSRMRNYVRDLFGSVLDTVDFPSKHDVDAIQVKLNLVNRKLD